MSEQLFSLDNVQVGPPPTRCSGCPAFRRVLLIQEPATAATNLEAVLCQSGCQVHLAPGLQEVLGEIGELDYEFILWDTHQPSREDLVALRHCRQRCPKLPVLALADGTRAETAIELIKAGASDVIAKPTEPAQLHKALERALKARRLLCDAVLIPCAAEPGCAARRLVGRSPALQEVYKQIGLVAERDEPVLICGETGTGKELIARAIHHHSRRKDRPFLAINCAAIPETLLESELFGHEKGSFTGAGQRRLGAFEQANGGTLFLDEIGDMPLHLQAKILRVLQQHEIQRVGSHEVVPVSVRILAATNKPLENALAARTFRLDLYYRLKVVSIHVPPLREHSQDIPELAEHFITHYTPPGEPRPALEARALEKLQTYAWPGNVRELENTIRRALVMAKGQAIMERDIVLGELAPGHGDPHPAPHTRPGSGKSVSEAEPVAFPEEELDRALQRWLAVQARQPAAQAAHPVPGLLEQKLLAAALRHTRGNQVQAARLLRISRATLRNWLKKYGAPTLPEAE